MDKKIAVIVGSMRTGSFSRQLAENLIPLFPEGFKAEIVEISHLPFFNQDWEGDAGTPQVVQDFRDQIDGYQAVLFVVPEYNRSYPGMLKNALDVGSRPYGQSKWNGKPAAIVSQSPGAIGGFGSNHHLRQVLTFLNMPVLQQPEAYIGNSKAFLGETGKVQNPDSIAYLQSIVDAFVDLIKRY